MSLTSKLFTAFLLPFLITAPVFANQEAEFERSQRGNADPHLPAKAEFSIYLFKAGKAFKQAQLFIDGKQVAEFDDNGGAYGRVNAGLHHFSIQMPDNKAYDFDLNTLAGENLQAIVTLFDDGRKPLLEIESSARGVGAAAGAGVAAQAAPKKNQGKGIIQGTVVSLETGKPIQGVQVYVSGMSHKFSSDAQGRFKIEAPVGVYSLSLLHPAFNTLNRENISISKEKTLNLKLSLTPAGVELPEHVVLEPYLAGTLASAIGEQRNSASVSNVLGAEQISRSGDSSVAAALRRVSGVTLVNGKFIFVRGLGERYSSTLVNSAPIPSPDPTRRVVPLNLFPTSFLDSIAIKKTYAVDRPAEFAGGTVDMRSRAIPDEFLMEFSGQIGFSPGTTFSKGLRYQGGDTDFLGIEDGTRAMPASIAGVVDQGGTIKQQTLFDPNGFTPQEIEQFGEDLSDVWNIQKKAIGPNGRMQFSLGNSFEFGDFGLGFFSSVRWSETWNSQDEIRRSLANSNNDVLQIKEDFKLQKTERNVQLDGYLNMEAHYLENHKLFGNALILRQTTDEARFKEGFTDAETTDVRRYRLRYIENQLFSLQFGGDHTFPVLSDLNIKWLYTRGRASRKAPKERRYRFDQLEDGSWSFSRRADSNQTLYSKLNDEDENWRLDVSLPFEPYKDIKLILQSGFLKQNKNRASDIRRYSYKPLGSDARDPDVLAKPGLEAIFVPQYIGPNGFQLLETTQSTDNYKAKQNLMAYYAQSDISLLDRVRIVGGLRWEENEQNVTTFKLFNPDNDPIVSGLKKNDMLPAVTGTWFINNKQQLRLGYSETLSRPDFRELSPAPFTDPVTDKITFGNPDLQQTSITNYDARWEYYFSDNENLSLGFFWKDLKDPIERVQVAGTGSLLTFQNAQKANVFGFEVELLKNLDFIWEGLENFYFSGNYTWSQSNVVLTEENLQVQTTNNRPLQGHSPHVINIQLGYDNPAWGTTATLLYNTTAKRIVEVGIQGLPDAYQMGFNQLDFVYNQRINDWFSVTFRMKNLLDDTVKVLQGDVVTRSYQPGRVFKMGIRLNY